MIRRKLSVILLVTVLFLAGCIGGVVVIEDGNDDSEIMTFNHQFEVIEVTGVTGPYSDSYCGIYSFEECHIFLFLSAT